MRIEKERPIGSELTVIIDACLEGDQRAWNELVERYGGLVHAIPRRMGLPGDLCDDVAQTVFVILLRRLSTLRDHQALTKWLMTTTRRECWRAIRRQGGSIEYTIEHDPATEDDPPDASLERAHAVRMGFRKLGERCQKLLRMQFLTEPPPDYKTIASTLDIPVGSIGPTRARCLEKRRESLGDAERDGGEA